MSRLIGDLALLEVGCCVWSKERVDDRANPRGGVIVAVTETVTDDGEVLREYVCCDPLLTYPLRFIRLGEFELDRETLEPPSEQRNRRLLRRFAEELCRIDRHRPRVGPFTADQAALVDYMRALRQVLMPVPVPHLGRSFRSLAEPPRMQAPVHPGLVDE